MDNYENNQNNQGYTPENNDQQPYQAQPQQYDTQQKTYEAQPQQYNTQQQTYEAQPQQQYNAQQPYQAQPQQYNAQPMPQQNKNDGKAIASLVLGICSIVFFCCFGIGIATGIPGLILGILSRKNKPENNTMATVGVILSIIGVALSVAYLIYYFVVIAPRASYYNTLGLNSLFNNY